MTAILDRAALFAELDRHLAECRDKGQLLGLLRVRLHRFRELNVVFGYVAGEALVRVAAERIAAALRPQDVVLQVGPSEFTVLLPGVLSANHAALAANRLVREFEAPLALEESQVPVGLAIGGAVFPEHGASADILCRNADRAYGEALRRTERYALHDSRGDDYRIGHELLHDALLSNRLEAYLQPTLDLATGAIAGAESLARWHNSRWGAVSPSFFVPLAERSGLIASLTRWSLNTTLRHCAAARAAGLALPFAFNLSPRMFGERGLVEQILGAMRIFDIPTSMLVLEVTEGALMEDPEQSVQVLGRLREAGLRIALDDFGVGYSSFTYLKRLPVTELKIDQSFVIDLCKDHRTLQLVRSLIDLAHHLDLAVVAEGVEDGETLARLTELGCDFAQGYHVGRPQPAAEFIAAQAAAMALVRAGT